MKALFTGSFDPITNGHLDVIKRIASIYESVIVGIAINETKKYMFPLELRKQMIEYQVPGNVVVMEVHGLVSTFAYENGVDVIVRGVRNQSDVESETTMADFNRDMGIETLFIPAKPEHRSISSSAVKTLVSHGIDTSNMVSLHVKHNLEHAMGYDLIGVVGNTGSGKSTFCNDVIRDLFILGIGGANYIDMDKLAHRMYNPAEPIYGTVSKLLLNMFGPDVINSDKTVNRKYIASQIFTNTSLKQSFDAMIRNPLHTMLRKEITSIVKNSCYPKNIIFVDASSLVEMGSMGMVNNNIIHVRVDKETSINRIMQRDGITLDAAEKRYNSQMSPIDRDDMIKNTITKDGYGALLAVDGSMSLTQFTLESIIKMGTPNND